MRKYDVYGIGNALVDYEIEVSNDFLAENRVEKGLMTLVEEERQKELVEAVRGNIRKKQGGGSAANSMIALSQFGGKGFYSCRVANDEDGHFYKQELDALGVDTNLKALPDGITGKCLVMVSPDAERTMNTFLGITSQLCVDDIDEEALAQAEYLYIEGYLVSSPKGMEAIHKIKQMARKHGVKIGMTFSDPSMVKYFGTQMKEAIVGGVDLLFANQEEAKLFIGVNDADVAFERLKSFAKKFVMTKSAKGAVVWDGQNAITIAPHEIKALDSTGAGDMFAGAFLYGITSGMSYEEAGKLASLASSRVVAQFGPRLANEEVQKLKSVILF
jgi:sugar/nucleoside kinase (ribokinase family)